MPPSDEMQHLAERWATAGPGERANYQLYLTELCEALGVERPRPAGSGYQFEQPVAVINRDGTETTNYIDLYKAGHFVLEAKDQKAEKADSALLIRAFGQVRTYAAAVPGDPPPYLMVLDVGKTLLVWDRWSGTYGGFNAAKRIPLATLGQRPDDVALLRAIWENPASQDPHARAAAVTREIARELAELSTALEKNGHTPETVARFLIRCVFTMFAEDIGLLPSAPFTAAIEEIGFRDPKEFQPALEELWRAMDEGGRFGLHRFLRFNGHFFKDREALPLTRAELGVLHRAALADWSAVEPAIMGTLLTRALDPEERHRLGAEFTPRAYVERLVRPTVEEPIRERWTRVEVEVLQLRDTEGKSARKIRSDEKKALARLREFHDWLRSLRFLDPACGSGNFLYVTLHTVKRIELEVMRAIQEITGQTELAVEEVGPWQFHGIEIKAWARELAELTLWVGFYQFWRSTHGHTQPPEPVLRDTNTIECRDAVLAWDEIVHVPEKDRPDPTPRIAHPVTGKLVPDPMGKLEYMEYRGVRQAEWPEADFIIGNPPYIGAKRLREALGDGYTRAIRQVYKGLPDDADFVMYWWYRAAREIAKGNAMRAGLITTNSIVQTFNRRVVEDAEKDGARVAWAVPDHPWIDGADGADVRVAMTVIAKDDVNEATRVEVASDGEVQRTVTVARLNADLTAHADVAGAGRAALAANRGISSVGYMLGGRGFILEDTEAHALINSESQYQEVIRPLRNGRDLMARPRAVRVVDFGTMEEGQARTYAAPYEIVRTRVKPQRDSNARASYRRYWWRFSEPRKTLREALEDLPRYIATPETARHRVFTFLDAIIVPEHKLICIASDDSAHLGVLSSSIHGIWALAAGGRLGVGNDPVYVKSRCFDAFPFPDPSRELGSRIGDLASQIDTHRKKAIERDEAVTMTGTYNVVEKLRSGEKLSKKERHVHEIAACGILKDLHDELDRLVAEAYGWPWPMEKEEILQRLVDLHDERVEEEKQGKIRWLRPEYQIPRFGKEADAVQVELSGEEKEDIRETEASAWPATTLEQIGALQELLTRQSATLEEVLGLFKGARREHVARHLETLVMMGEISISPDGTFGAGLAAA